MEVEALKDFELYLKVDEKLIKKYEGQIPEQFIEIWKMRKEYGGREALPERSAGNGAIAEPGVAWF